MVGIEAQADCDFEDAFLIAKSRLRGSSLPRNGHVIIRKRSQDFG